jgi:ATP-dependent Lhr-like helicase
LSADGQTILAFLQANGASFGRDLEAGTALTWPRLHRALQELAEFGLVSGDNYPGFLSIFESALMRASDAAVQERPDASAQRWIPARQLRTPSTSTQRHPTRADIRKLLSEKSRFKDGRWFLTTSFGVMGKPLDDQLRAESQARLLLERYGILVKEWYRREQGLLDWYHLFQILKRLEWRGEIRRGYFISGLSGVQFALPAALELLENVNREPPAEDEAPVMLSSLDPALPYGGGLDGGLTDADGNPVQIVRSASNHVVLAAGEVILISENHFQRLLVLRDLPETMWPAIIQLLKDYLQIPYPLKKQNRIEIHQINHLPATSSSIAAVLTDAGFEKDGDTLVLWSVI